MNCLDPGSYSLSAFRALDGPWDLSEPQLPHPQGGIRDLVATSGGLGTDPSVAWAVTAGLRALQTPGRGTSLDAGPSCLLTLGTVRGWGRGNGGSSGTRAAGAQGPALLTATPG